METRAFNVSKEKEACQHERDLTISDFFQNVLQKESLEDDDIITHHDILSALGLNLKHEDLFKKQLVKLFHSWGNNPIQVRDFIYFLENGSAPTTQFNKKDKRSNEWTKPKSTLLNIDNYPLYPSVWVNLEFQILHRLDSTSNQLSTHFQKPTFPSQNSSHPREKWKKKETVLQEKTVVYTTIGPDGHVQELMETVKQQNHVLHMEMKDSEEFAHHEFNEYEQTETFNEELVSGNHGTEEFLHLKSVDDEYEFFDNQMPSERQTV